MKYKLKPCDCKDMATASKLNKMDKLLHLRHLSCTSNEATPVISGNIVVINIMLGVEWNVMDTINSALINTGIKDFKFYTYFYNSLSNTLTFKFTLNEQ